MKTVLSLFIFSLCFSLPSLASSSAKSVCNKWLKEAIFNNCSNVHRKKYKGGIQYVYNNCKDKAEINYYVINHSYEKKTCSFGYELEVSKTQSIVVGKAYVGNKIVANYSFKNIRQLIAFALHGSRVPAHYSQAHHRDPLNQFIGNLRGL